MNFFGAHYRKTDLQLHSPRDANWSGGRPSTEEHGSIEAARNFWANSFIDACLKQGIQVAALTDHHEGVYCWHVVSELEKRKQQGEINFWFMPGMELTCKDSAQALLLFDSSISKKLFEKVRNLLMLVSDVKEEKPTGIQVELLSSNINDLQELLEADPEIRGKFIILPNVTPEGHKSVLRTGFHARYKDMPYVGGYLDKIYPSDISGVGDRKILAGEVPAWTSEKRGIISTSDARTADFANLGQFATWLKMTVPTAESLRQAMLAADSRIQYKQPSPPDLFIQSVTVIDADFLVLNSPLYFSSQFSALIGGRGSGKSTLLEYVRYALGISALDKGDSSWDPTYERRKSLLEATLSKSSSSVELVMLQMGVQIRLVRSSSNRHQVLMRVNGKEKSLSLEDVRAMFPVQAYSQGELSHLGDEKAEKRLSDLITSPSKDKLEEVEKSLKAVAGDLRKLLAQAEEYWRLEGEQRQVGALVLTAQAGIESTQQNLRGIGDATQKILNEHKVFSHTNLWLEGLVSDYDSSFATLASAFENYIKIPEKHLGSGVPAAPAAQALAGAVQEQIGVASEVFIKLQAAHQDFVLQRVADEAQWVEAQAIHATAYNQAVAESQHYTASLSRLKVLESQLEAEQRKHDGLSKRMEPLKTAHLDILTKGAEYISLQHQLRKLYGESAQQLAALTSDQARAELSPTADTTEIEAAVNALIAGSGIHATRKESLIIKLKEQDVLTNWWKFIEELLSVLHWKITGLHATQQRPPLPLLDPTIDSGGLHKFCEQLSIERVSGALTAVVRPRVRLLQKRGTEEIEFSKASQGEKATILLNVLMRQPGGPLLLDQPEEDLDNRIIGDIVGAIKDAKNKKQLVFATHNANLVVNGDAELVVDLANGRINEIGAIDLPALRDSITETMEGGKEAFELRRRKYNF